MTYRIGDEVEVLIIPTDPSRGWARARITGGPVVNHSDRAWDVEGAHGDGLEQGAYRFEDEMRHARGVGRGG